MAAQVSLSTFKNVLMEGRLIEVRLYSCSAPISFEIDR